MRERGGERRREKEGIARIKKGRLLLSIHHCHLLALAEQTAADPKNEERIDLRLLHCYGPEVLSTVKTPAAV